MKMILTPDKRYVEVLPEAKKDFTVLGRFPGFEKIEGRLLAPAKINVVYNLVRRLKRVYQKGIKVSKEVHDIYNTPFKLREIPSPFHYFTTPLHHQEIALRFLYTNKGGGLLLDPGLGKTKVVLDYIALESFAKSLVICPKALLYVWKKEAGIHRKDKRVHVIQSVTWDKKIRRLEAKIQDLEERGDEDPKKIRDHKTLLERMRRNCEKDRANTAAADIVVVNYEKAAMGSLYLAESGFDFMAIDEGLVKDPKTNRTKAITRLSRFIPYVCIMSGTLVNNTPLDIFAPVRVLEPALVGRSFTRFRDRYCNMVPVKNEEGETTGRFIGSYKDSEEVRGILRSISIVMRKEEWLDLPEKKFFTHTVEPTENQIQLSDELTRNYVTQFNGEYVEVDSPLTLLAKLYQVSNGFFYAQDDDELTWNELTGEIEKVKAKRRSVIFKEQPKIDKLQSLLEGELKERKLILWYNLQAEYDLITKLLKRKDISYTSIKGGEKNTFDKVEQFNEDTSIQILLCQAKAVNYGITVLGQNPEQLDSDVSVFPDLETSVYTEVFYSLSFSLEIFIQQQDRIHRIGQMHEAEYHILMSNTPVENKLKQAIDDKTVLREDFLTDMAQELLQMAS